MKSSVISKEYLALQTDISNKQAEWVKELEVASIEEKSALAQNNVPIVTQVEINVDKNLYKKFILELAQLLEQKDEKLAIETSKLKDKLSEDVIKRWVEEVLSFNQLYFANYASEAQVAEWLPYLLAEHSIRPFLRNVSKQYSDELSNMNTKGSCPCCGEPVRLAVLDGKGKKMLTCPRCEAKWNLKRLQCSFCGTEENKKLQYYAVENDATAQIEVCEECNNYIKVIDTRKHFKKQTPFLLDVSSIHLDIIAQEKGFGITKEEISS